MRQELERIIELQPHWSQENNAPMVERGALIRQEGPAWLRTFAPELASQSQGTCRFSRTLLARRRYVRGRRACA